MKTYIIIAVILTYVGMLSIANATKKGDPFEDLWNVIVNLQEQIDNIQLIPGPEGPQGIRGEPGLPAKQGAGNIAFMHDGDSAYLLKTDGTVWMTVSGPSLTQIEGPISQLPVPVSDVVAWEYYSLVDKDGNYWYFYYRTGRNIWINLGPIPES